MILSSMNEILEQIADFVDTCLGPLGKNGFNWSQLRDMIIQLCATLILFIVIRVFLWKRITGIIEARRDSIDKELDEAKENNAKARALVAETQAKLDEAQALIKARLDKAEYDANLRRDEIIAQARA
ncbi:MAG: ATP synthase F0 subunit B, partial [Anaeroplasmataceae bacterium]